MNILVNTTVVGIRQIVVDDMHDIANIESAGRHTGGDQDRTFAGTERTPAPLVSGGFRRVFGIILQGILSLTLGAVTVNGRGWKTEIEQVVVKKVDTLLRVAEDDRSGRRHREQEVVRGLLLCVSFGEDHL